MAARKIIEIDRDLCNGCGLCTTACAEGALELDDEGKAVLVKEIYCDGMGVCLNVCPTGALAIIDRDSDEYDAEEAREHVRRIRGDEAAENAHRGPGTAAEGTAAEETALAAADAPAGSAAVPGPPAPSELSQWPIQLHLISPAAPYFKGADLLVAADCTAFTRGSFHADLLRGHRLVVACPKLDETGPYVEKLAALIRQGELKSLTVALMAVPCCGGLLHIAQQAVTLSGLDIPIHTVTIGLDGEIVARA